MCCIAEIAMFVMGIVTLVKGSFQVSRKRAVTGAPAYAIGMILVAVLPVALLSGFLIGFVIALRTGRQPTVDQLQPLAFLDVAAVLIALLAITIIGFTTAKEPRRTTSGAAPLVNPTYRPLDPNNPYASPQGDERDRFLDEMQ